MPLNDKINTFLLIDGTEYTQSYCLMGLYYHDLRGVLRWLLTVLDRLRPVINIILRRASQRIRPGNRELSLSEKALSTNVSLAYRLKVAVSKLGVIPFWKAS